MEEPTVYTGKHAKPNREGELINKFFHSYKLVLQNFFPVYHMHNKKAEANLENINIITKT